MDKPIKFILFVSIFFCLLISLQYVSAAFSASLNTRYINRTYVSEINISILSGKHGNGTRAANITQVTISLPNGYSFVLGSNLTTSNMNFSNTSSTLVWNATGGESFPNNTIKDFRFNATSSIAGDATITTTATRSDGANNVSSLTLTTNFNFEGYVKNETGGNESNVNVTIYQFVLGTGGPPKEVYEANTLTNANGSFSLSSINGSATNYLLKMIRYGNSGSGCVSANSSCNATMTGTVLPPFPSMMYYPQSSDFDFSLNGSNFYLQSAATLRLYTWAYNGTNPVQQRFGYQVIDQKVGFPVESNLMQNVTSKDIIVPSGKSYSLMFMRDFSQFRSSTFCNGTSFNDSDCPSPPATNSSLGTITAGQIIIVNQSLIITRNRLYGCINIQPSHNSTLVNVTAIKLKMIPFSTSSGAFIPEFDASQGEVNISKATELNVTNSSGTATSDGFVCPGSSAAYNISVLGSASGISYFVEIYAKNTSVANDAATNVGGNYLAGFANITITGNTRSNITLYKLLGTYTNDSINKNKLNTSMMKVNIINESGGAITNGMHVEVSIKNSNIGIGTVHYMVETLTNGTFYIPILNNSEFAEVSVFPNDAPPLVKKLNLSSNDNNVTLVTIEFGGGGDKGMRQFNESGQLEEINASSMPIQIRFLRRGTDQVITEMNATSFNPMKALVAGQIDLELKVLATNVTMRFNNFDMFSAKQPPMFAILDNDTASSDSQTWKFGNFVPKDVYDNVTLIIPYNPNSVSESGNFSMSIPTLYTEDPSQTHQLTSAWNISAGYSHSNLTDEFIAYNATRYRNYLTSSGVNCSKTDTSSVCYINITSNELRMEIPHFSGLSPSMVVAAPGSSGSSSSAGSSSGGLTNIALTVTPNLLSVGYTSLLKKSDKLKMNFSGEIHNLDINEITNDSVTITISSNPQKATLGIGENKKFDVNEDNYYDLIVTINSIVNNKASITVKSIKEEIPLANEIFEEKDEANEDKEVFDEEKALNDEKMSLGLWIIIIVILALIFFLIIIIVYNINKKSKYYKR